MVLNVVHPIVLGQALSDLTPIREPLERVLRRCELWWESKGVYLLHGSVLTLAGHDIDTSLENPWQQTRARITQERLPAGHLSLVFLHGWDDYRWAGWGGPPMAVVGEWAMRLLASVGSPDAIWDDEYTGFLVMHEIGHALGLPHDFSDPNYLMSYGYRGFDSILGPASWDTVQLAGCELPREGSAPR